MSGKKGHKEFFEVYRTSPADEKSKPEKKEAPKKARYKNIEKPEIDEAEKLRKSTKITEPQTPKQVTKITEPQTRKYHEAEKDKGVKSTEKKPDTNVSRNKPLAPKYEPRKWIRDADKAHDIHVSKKVTHIPEEEAESLSGKLKVIGKENVKLSQETIIIFAVAATFLSIACFFMGYKVGHNKGVQVNSDDFGTVKEEPVVINTKKDAKDKNVSLNLFSDDKKDVSAIPEVKRSSNDLWTLRMISYRNVSSNLSKATKLAKAIKNMTGANAFVAKSGNELIVCVGKFKSDNDQELIDLQIKMAGLVYEKKKQFKGCYPVKLK